MGTVIQLKKQINNSYFELKNSVEEKLILEYTEPNYKKMSGTMEISNYVKSYYSQDYDLWMSS